MCFKLLVYEKEKASDTSIYKLENNEININLRIQTKNNKYKNENINSISKFIEQVI